jgi:transcriptional regulator with XRE-family HTH domain
VVDASVYGVVAVRQQGKDADLMSKLLGIIDAYKDTHGQPSDASIARAINVAPQTISSWRKRGIRDLPEPDTLRHLAAFVGVPPLTVVDAALIDAGYLTEEELRQRPSAAPMGEVRAG